MVVAKQKHSGLDKYLEEIEAIMDASNIQIFGARQLTQTLHRAVDYKFRGAKITIDDLKSFLINKSQLRRLGFQTPRSEVLYTWRAIDHYQLMPALRPNGYYTHLTALCLHGLLNYQPENVYFNNEQRARPITGSLEQSRIDNAFRKKQRITTARTSYDDKIYWLLNGKQTGNHGVILIKTPNGNEVPVTDLERTLVDISVRPAYAGGVSSVLTAYRLAQPKISIPKLRTTLRSVNHMYPYCQCVGFYIDMAGVYPDEAIQEFVNYDPFRYDFYLDYEMKNPNYSEKWKLYYPKTLL